jgi:hypothetical protein
MKKPSGFPIAGRKPDAVRIEARRVGALLDRRSRVRGRLAGEETLTAPARAPPTLWPRGRRSPAHWPGLVRVPTPQTAPPNDQPSSAQQEVEPCCLSVVLGSFHVPIPSIISGRCGYHQPTYRRKTTRIAAAGQRRKVNLDSSSWLRAASATRRTESSNASSIYNARTTSGTAARSSPALCKYGAVSV